LTIHAGDKDFPNSRKYLECDIFAHGFARACCDAIAGDVRWPMLVMEIKQRPNPSAEGLEIWMDIYKHPAGLIEEVMASIAQLVAKIGLPLK